MKADKVWVGADVVLQGMNYIVDTGTSLMMGNKIVVGQMTAMQVDKTYKGDSCLPNVIFVIGYQQYVLSPDDYV